MTTESDIRIETWKPVAPMDGCTFSGYEVSDKGAFRSVDRMVSGRNYKGQDLRTSPHEDGYRLIRLRCDNTSPEHKRAHAFTAHAVVLTTFDRPCPPGMEARHSTRGPAFNWWPEGIRWGTKAENHADQVAAGTAVIPEPTFPCLNAQNGCPSMVKNRGRRCRACVVALGRDAAAYLNGGMPLEEVAGRFGNSADWIFRLAVEHGGYEGSKADARGVPHAPCRCPACSAPPSLGVFKKLTATLRNRSRSATR